MKPANKTFTALSAFLTHDTFGATDGLTAGEVTQWDNYVAGLAVAGVPMPSHVRPDGTEPFFGCCEVTGLRGTVETFTAVWV